MNPLKRLQEFGQSVWYDNIERKMLRSGELAGMIKDDGLRGITSNPTIFEKAIAASKDYDEGLARFSRGAHKPDARAAFFSLAIEDIQAAADLLKPVYEATHGQDGMVSLEVSPDLAYDTEATVTEALSLWKRVGRANLMIKVPATREGVVAFEKLISEGLNVNVTLLFSVERYKEITEAYLAGLDARLRRGLPVKGIASVASFFVSRVDATVDKLLDERLAKLSGAEREPLQKLQGKIAIANAKVAYEWYQHLFTSPRFDKLKQAGAAPQRLLWASTGVKNPNYSDVMYIEQLIGPDTVNTVPPATYAAYKQHGRPQTTLLSGWDEAHAQLAALKTVDIDLAAITQQLEDEGVKSFAKSFDNLLAAINGKLLAFQTANVRAAG